MIDSIIRLGEIKIKNEVIHWKFKLSTHLYVHWDPAQPNPKELMKNRGINYEDFCEKLPESEI